MVPKTTKSYFRAIAELFVPGPRRLSSEIHASIDNVAKVRRAYDAQDMALRICRKFLHQFLHHGNFAS
jgi:hypothetical protein